MGVSRDKNTHDKGPEGPPGHGNAGSPEHRMVPIKVARWFQDKKDLCSEGPHSRAILLWGCQGMQMVTVKKDHPGVEVMTGAMMTPRTDAAGVGWQLFGAEREVVNHLNCPKLGQLGH